MPLVTFVIPFNFRLFIGFRAAGAFISVEIVWNDSRADLD